MRRRRRGSRLLGILRIHGHDVRPSPRTADGSGIAGCTGMVARGGPQASLTSSFHTSDTVSPGRAGRPSAGGARGGARSARMARWSTSSVRRRRRLVERRAEPAAEDAAEQLERLGRRSALPRRSAPAQHAALVPGRRRRGRRSAPHTAQASSSGRKPSRASSFQKNAATTSGLSRAARARSAPSSIRYRLGFGSRSSASWSTASSIGHGPGQPVEVVAEGAEVVDRSRPG